MASMRRSLISIVSFRVLVLCTSMFFVSGPLFVSAQTQPEPRSKDLESAIELIRDQHHSEAISILKKLTTTNSQDVSAWFYLGLAYFHLNDKQQAIKALEKAAELDPGFAQTHAVLAQTYRSLGNTSFAIASIDRALSIEPNNPNLHYFRAFISFASLKEVIKHADLAISLDPNFAEAHLLKAQAIMNSHSSSLFGSGDEADRENQRTLYKTAAEPLNKYLQLVPESDNKRAWTEIVETMTNFTVSDRQAILTGKQVSTKVRLISKPEPQYTNEARRFSVKGTVVLKVVFASDASVKHVHLISALPGGLTEEAIKAALKIKFVPATLEGQPVSMWMQLEYNFNLY